MLDVDSVVQFEAASDRPQGDVKPGRKIIQILETFYGHTLFALCADGTLWKEQHTGRGPKWVRLPGPPVDDDDVSSGERGRALDEIVLRRGDL